ncbi:hypothetical protein DFH94DRAFT_688442 [Russula ochroleuca]|uniref:Uncharacterized protein n=1 Tax=Russula ochroleuca TaxID=152965 RepID=A0A9P5N4K8_9AGAM|nr:hypothetical protein DFH94DRAFT_688442 [Russula ochroleuca]
MKSYLFSILSAVLFVVGVSAQLTINTPSVLFFPPVMCISSTRSSERMCFLARLFRLPGVVELPLTLFIHDGNNPNGAALLTFANLTGGSYTWSSVTFIANTNLDLTLRDNSGLIAQSAPFVVQSGGSTSCLNSTAVPSTIVATTPGTGATTNAASSTGTTPAATGTTPGATGQTKATSSASGSSSSPKSSGNAAVSNDISYGMAGVLGAVVAAIFV